MIAKKLKRSFFNTSFMKTLKKPSELSDTSEAVNLSCEIQCPSLVSGCPNLECVCRSTGGGNDSVSDEEIIF